MSRKCKSNSSSSDFDDDVDDDVREERWKEKWLMAADRFLLSKNVYQGHGSELQLKSKMLSINLKRARLVKIEGRKHIEHDSTPNAKSS
jgi:thymidylate kinase